MGRHEGLAFEQSVARLSTTLSRPSDAVRPRGRAAGGTERLDPSCYGPIMWTHGAAIRPVPEYAKVPMASFETVRETFDGDNDETEQLLAEAFEQMEESQPALAARAGEALTEELGETALALGYFLVLAIWLAFEDGLGEGLGEVSQETVDATESLLLLEDELRRAAALSASSIESTIAMEQPAVLAFVREQIGTALEIRAPDLTAEHLADVFHLVMLEVLALSYSVEAPLGYPVSKQALPA